MPPADTAADRIVLVGFMGAGKTTVGAELARRIGWGFLDMDRWIEERTGLTVAETFGRLGEAAFREEERRAAVHAATLHRHVVAAGGGAFAFPETRAALQADAVTVWLVCDLETALARIGEGAGRPLAASRERMRTMLAERESSYRLADLRVDGSRRPGEVAQRIVDALGARWPRDERTRG